MAYVLPIVTPLSRSCIVKAAKILSRSVRKTQPCKLDKTLKNLQNLI
jgi:hypothetical protein